MKQLHTYTGVWIFYTLFNRRQVEQNYKATLPLRKIRDSPEASIIFQRAKHRIGIKIVAHRRDVLQFLDPLQRSPYRTLGGMLGEAAIRGATFFCGTNRVARHKDAGCATCHVPETGFCDFQFHNIGQRQDSSEREQALRVASRWIEPDLMARAFGWDVREVGY